MQHRSALDDPRVCVHNVDPRYFVKTQADRFDLVIARLPEPMSALRARLYTVEFFKYGFRVRGLLDGRGRRDPVERVRLERQCLAWRHVEEARVVYPQFPCIARAYVNAANTAVDADHLLNEGRPASRSASITSCWCNKSLAHTVQWNVALFHLYRS